MCREGLRSSPGNLCCDAEILGLLHSPSRHKAAPTGIVRSAMIAQGNQTALFNFTHEANLSTNACKNGRVLSLSFPPSSNRLAAPPM